MLENDMYDLHVYVYIYTHTYECDIQPSWHPSCIDDCIFICFFTASLLFIFRISKSTLHQALAREEYFFDNI